MASERAKRLRASDDAERRNVSQRTPSGRRTFSFLDQIVRGPTVSERLTYPVQSGTRDSMTEGRIPHDRFWPALSHEDR